MSRISADEAGADIVRCLPFFRLNVLMIGRSRGEVTRGLSDGFVGDPCSHGAFYGISTKSYFESPFHTGSPRKAQSLRPYLRVTNVNCETKNLRGVT